jgi:guanyl-specific ribonuclease Sa
MGRTAAPAKLRATFPAAIPMRSLKPLLVLAVLAIAAIVWNRHAPAPAPVPAPTAEPAPRSTGTARPAPAPSTEATAARTASSALPAFLPPEARDTLALIARGGPFPHRQDGTVFGNREGRLPPQPRGYYHEYTVDTPGLDYRGARRIITGGHPPMVYYYTDDHYRTFHPFEMPR